MINRNLSSLENGEKNRWRCSHEENVVLDVARVSLGKCGLEIEEEIDEDEDEII